MPVLSPGSARLRAHSTRHNLFVVPSMQRLRCLALCALVSVAGSGCATYLNLQDQSHADTSELNIWETAGSSTPKSVYGGVAIDAEFSRGMLTNPTEHDPRAVPLGLYA